MGGGARRRPRCPAEAGAWPRRCWHRWRSPPRSGRRRRGRRCAGPPPRSRPARAVRLRRSSRSKTPSASRRKNRGMPFSSTCPRGLSSAAPGRSRSPRGSRSSSFPPVPWSRSSGGRPGSVGRDESVDESERRRGHDVSVRGPRRGNRTRRQGLLDALAHRLVHRRKHEVRSQDSAAGSSIANPGASVAISNSTPPGSRK